MCHGCRWELWGTQTSWQQHMELNSQTWCSCRKEVVLWRCFRPGGSKPPAWDSSSTIGLRVGRKWDMKEHGETTMASIAQAHLLSTKLDQHVLPCKKINRLVSMWLTWLLGLLKSYTIISIVLDLLMNRCLIRVPCLVLVINYWGVIEQLFAFLLLMRLPLII